jgi:hypothetical protein
MLGFIGRLIVFMPAVWVFTCLLGHSSWEATGAGAAAFAFVTSFGNS